MPGGAPFNGASSPASTRAGRNRLPGLPKWMPVAAVIRPGLMPTNSSRIPGPARSGTSASR